MTQAKVKLASFEEYLAYSDETPLSGRYELVGGALVELPPESEENNWLALNLRDYLIQTVPRRLVRVHACEVQVPVLQPQDAANRFPDLIVLRPEHLDLTRRRLTITLDMPPPRLIVEVVSPGQANRDRDYDQKRAQYAAIEVPEYWLVDPITKAVTVLTLAESAYQDVGVFGPQTTITSVELPHLSLAVDQIFDADG
jgi:Uma2 family endonuclease